MCINLNIYIMSNKKYTCKICGKDICCRFMPHHLKKEHGIEASDYYVKYINPIIPKCRCCGKPLLFWKFSKPYGSTCGSKECVSKMHSETMSELNKDPEFQKLANEGQRNAINTNPDLKLLKQSVARTQLKSVNKNLTLKERQQRGRLARFNQYIRSDERKGFTERYFYIIDFSDYVKIGIYRCPKNGDFSVYRLREYMDTEGKVYNLILYKGNNIEVLNLEDTLVWEFYDSHVEDSKYGTEVFLYSERENIINKVNELICSTTIEKILEEKSYSVI